MRNSFPAGGGARRGTTFKIGGLRIGGEEKVRIWGGGGDLSEKQFSRRRGGDAGRNIQNWWVTNLGYILSIPANICATSVAAMAGSAQKIAQPQNKNQNHLEGSRDKQRRRF